MKKIALTILGATGSIGKNTLDIVARHCDKFAIFALTANNNFELLLTQAEQFKPQHVVIVDEQAGQAFAKQAKARQLSCEIHVGVAALTTVATHDAVDTVMAAIVGAAGLLPTLAAAKAGKRILLANKEALVMTGELFMNTAKHAGAKIIPVDSEHNAIFQCLPANFATSSLAEQGIKRLVLTASGGPFLKTPLSELKTVTPEQACAHPNWKMGQKISVDSATMMNKGLEVIEAHWLFAASQDQLDVIIHPQSIVHSMVEYIDGSVLAELGMPDMRTPIAHALGLPLRLLSGVKSLNLIELQKLEFYALELTRYPLIKLAYQTLSQHNTVATCLNAANEVAVAAFLQQSIGFLQIAELVAEVLDKVEQLPATTLENILEIDQRSRRIALEILKQKG